MGRKQTHSSRQEEAGRGQRAEGSRRRGEDDVDRDSGEETTNTKKGGGNREEVMRNGLREEMPFDKGGICMTSYSDRRVAVPVVCACRGAHHLGIKRHR